VKLLKMALLIAVLVCLLATAAIAGANAGIVRHGGNGPDTITGTKFNDRLYGEHGPDTLRGRAGRDVLDGGVGGGDVCIGGRGADVYRECEVVRK
jgi:Ca2+-binding RTX toxin-like protein